MAGLLWFIIAALVVFWIAGMVLHLFGGLIHIALVVAAVLFIFNMFTARSRA